MGGKARPGMQPQPLTLSASASALAPVPVPVHASVHIHVQPCPSSQRLPAVHAPPNPLQRAASCTCLYDLRAKVHILDITPCVLVTLAWAFTYAGVVVVSVVSTWERHQGAHGPGANQRHLLFATSSLARCYAIVWSLDAARAVCTLVALVVVVLYPLTAKLTLPMVLGIAAATAVLATTAFFLDRALQPPWKAVIFTTGIPLVTGVHMAMAFLCCVCVKGAFRTSAQALDRCVNPRTNQKQQ